MSTAPILQYGQGSTYQLIKPASRKRRRIAFAIAIGLLAIAALARVTVVQAFKLSFQKLPVSPAAALITIPPVMGPWMQASVDRAMNPDFEHELGTKEYVFRDYIDTRVLAAPDLAKFLAASLE
ncbi:MAG: hypothetical protein H7144_06150, partial [Burkholderiales bacterium]|nr:hypothetical protein [Phycisphaerae bacterium]